jgi:hypothetical protein
MKKPSGAEITEVRHGTDADIPEVVELMKASLGEGEIPRTEQFWRWKHRENPFGASAMFLAKAGAQLVGVRLFMRWRWQLGDRTVGSVRAVDTATHPDFQGRGIFKRLTLLGAEQLTMDRSAAFVFNTPNDQSRPGYLKMGWRSLGRVSLWGRLCNPLRFALKNGAPIWEPASGPPDGAAHAIEAAHSAGLLERLRPGPRLETPRTLPYLRWRFVDCPAASYGAASSAVDQTLVLYRLRQRGGRRELTIEDILCAPTWRGTQQTARTLRELVRTTQPDYAIAAFRPAAYEAAALTSSGFVPAPWLGPIFTTRDLAPDPAAPDLGTLASFRLSIGDLELF